MKRVQFFCILIVSKAFKGFKEQACRWIFRIDPYVTFVAVVEDDKSSPSP